MHANGNVFLHVGSKKKLVPTYRKFINPSSEFLAKTTTIQTIAESENEAGRRRRRCQSECEQFDRHVHIARQINELSSRYMYHMCN